VRTSTLLPSHRAGDEEVIELVGLDPEDRLFLGDEALLDHVDGNLYRSQAGALAVAGLEHVELGVLNGELEVLHVMVVLSMRVVMSRSWL